MPHYYLILCLDLVAGMDCTAIGAVVLSLLDRRVVVVFGGLEGSSDSIKNFNPKRYPCCI